MANVNVTYGQMRDAAKKLDNGRIEIDNMLGQLKSQIESLVAEGYVTDSSSKNFQSSYEDFTTGAKEAVGGLEGMSAYLNKAAQTFEDADSSLASSLGR